LSDDRREGSLSGREACSDGGRESARDFQHDFWQATFDLNSYLSQAQVHQQHDVTVPTDTLKILLEGVETIKRTQRVQEKQSVASLYMGTILGALIGVTGNFFVSFWFMPKNLLNSLGLTISFILLFMVCLTLFFQAKSYAQEQS
jgi:hypothetical protein